MIQQNALLLVVLSAQINDKSGKKKTQDKYVKQLAYNKLIIFTIENLYKKKL